MLQTTWGVASIKWMSDRISEFLKHSEYGAALFFGPKFVDFPIAMGVSSFIILRNLCNISLV